MLPPRIDVKINDKQMIAAIAWLRTVDPELAPLAARYAKNLPVAKKLILKGVIEDIVIETRKKIIKNNSYVTGNMYRSMKERTLDPNHSVLEFTAQKGGEYYAEDVEEGGLPKYIPNLLVVFDHRQGKTLHIKGLTKGYAPIPFIRPSMEKADHSKVVNKAMTKLFKG